MEVGKAIDYQITVRVIGEPSKEAIFKVYDYLLRSHAEQTNTTPRGPISFANKRPPTA